MCLPTHNVETVHINAMSCSAAMFTYEGGGPEMFLKPVPMDFLDSSMDSFSQLAWVHLNLLITPILLVMLSLYLGPPGCS